MLDPHAGLRGDHSRRLAPGALGLALLLAALSGCAGMAARKAAEARLGRELTAAGCDGKTLDQAWDEARRLLLGHDYQLAGPDRKALGLEPGLLDKAGLLGSILTAARATHVEDDGSRQLETDWKEARRIRLVGAPRAPGCHVNFLSIREDPSAPLHDVWEAPTRDVALELELLRLLAPDEARRIEGVEAPASPAAAPPAPAPEAPAPPAPAPPDEATPPAAPVIL